MGKLVGDIEKTDIITVENYSGTLILGTLPIIGDILLYKWGKDAKVRENKRNLCKAYLKTKLILIYPVTIVLMLMSYMFAGV